MVDEKTTQEIIDAYMGWDRIEKSNGIDIIDFCLIPRRKGEEFKSREQVLERIKDLHSRIKPTNNEEEFIQAKLYASITYLRALMGELIPFNEYVKNITGVTPQVIPEKVVQKHKEIMYDRLKAVGYKPEESIDQSLERITITKGEAMEQIKHCQKKLIPIVLKSLGFEDLEIPYEVRLVEVDDYWKGWTSTKPDGSFLLRYNFFEDIKWYKGDMEVLTLHEVAGHFVQGTNLANGIKSCEINSFIGVTTVQDPHTFSGEGSANSILDLPEVEEAFSPYGLLTRDRSIFGYYIRNNAHIWVNQGRDKDWLVEYVHSNYPFYTKDYIVKALDRWKNNPSRRAYEYVYGISRFLHRQLLARMSLENRKEFLRHEMTRYDTPERLMKFANQLFSD